MLNVSNQYVACIIQWSINLAKYLT